MNGLMTNDEKIEDDEINLLDYWKVLVKRKLLIAVITGVAVIGSVIYSLTLEWYFINKINEMKPLL